MKRFYITLIALVLIYSAGWGQNTYYWQPGAGGQWTTASNWNTQPDGSGSTRSVTNNGDVLIIDQGTTQTISNIPSQTVAELRIVSGSITLAGAGGTQTFTIANGAGDDLIIESGASLTLSSNLENLVFGTSATATISGELIVSNTYSLSANNTVTTVAAGGVLEVTNQITNATTAKLVMNGTYRHARNGGTVPTATWNSGSTMELSGLSNLLPGGLSQTFASFAFTSPITDDIEIGANITTTEDFIVNFNGGPGDDLRLTDGNTNRIFTVGRNFILSSGLFSIDHDNGDSELRIAGDYIQNGGTLAETGSGRADVIFNGTGVQLYNKTAGSISGTIDFFINSGATVDFGLLVLDNTGNFTLSGGGKIITSNANGLTSSGTTGTITSTGTRFYSSTADYEFRGASTGNFTTAGDGVRDLIINNTSGEVAMGRNFTISRNLTLENGYITPGVNTLLVGTAGNSTSNNNAYVNGQLQKSFSNSSAFTFYVGKASSVGMRAIGLTTNTGSGTSTFTAEFIRADANTAIGNTLGSGLARVSACEYWTLDRSGAGSRGGAVTLSWAANSDCSPVSQYITNLLTLRVARFDGSSWVDAGANITGGSTLTVGSISSNAVTSFSPFALASGNQADNPLPVLFDGVRAYGKDGGVHIEWSNLTERDIVRYEVERSANGVDYYPINQQAPKSNRDDKASYTHFDAAPINGANFYRIRVDEIGGKPVYSKILRVEMGSTKAASFSLYPNPVVGKQLTVSLNGLRQGQYSLQVFNTSGQRVYSTNINNVGAGVTQMIELPATLKSGMYVTVVSGDDFRESKQFILQ